MAALEDLQYNIFMPIKILPDEVASQIAAGEVVERPASVVKELIENALDASSQRISLSVEEAGKKSITAADDGLGIPPEEMHLAVARHATSKLSTAEDLFRVSTLGFRGEALASIASVSQMTITSRVEGEELGARITIEGGKITASEELGAPPGTVVQVRNLFYNVPARLKFLKSDRTEWRHINDLVSQYALANPGVRFHLEHNGRVVFQTTGSGETREVLAAVYGVETAQKMITVLAEEQPLKVFGYLSPPGLTRSNRREITFFVNSRPVQDAALSKALTQGYHTLLMKGRYPLAVLFLELPPELVDVNVHPTKAEVRFRNRGEIFRGVEKAVRRALMVHTPVPEMGSLAGASLWQGAAPDHSQVRRRDPEAWGAASDRSWGVGQQEEGEGVDRPLLETPILRLIGQVAATYLIAEGPDGLYLIDQHAAHERVLFEKFLERRQQTLDSQSLLEPAVVQFTPAAADLVAEQLGLLEDLGFELEEFGGTMFKIRSIPVLLAGISPEAGLRAAVEDLEVDETPLEENLEEKIIARVCKRAAVKAGQVLSPEEQKTLLKDLEACQSPRTCPHGRPTMIHLPVDLLERKFGRTGKL